MTHSIYPWAAIATLIAVPAFAQSSAPLEVASKIFVEHRSTDADGVVQTRLEPARRAVPGDHVVFVLAYRNGGALALKDIILDSPVPDGVTFQASTEGLAAPELSIDGKRFDTLDGLRSPLPDGGSRAATADDIRHVRWRLAGALPAGSSGQVAYRGVLK